jgi:hypothetical protein
VRDCETGKICYPTREAALESAERHNAKMTAYDWCLCGQWHLAKKNRKSRRRGDVLRGH